jgi:hypothetical protein
MTAPAYEDFESVFFDEATFRLFNSGFPFPLSFSLLALPRQRAFLGFDRLDLDFAQQVRKRSSSFQRVRSPQLAWRPYELPSASMFSSPVAPLSYGLGRSTNCMRRTGCSRSCFQRFS